MRMRAMVFHDDRRSNSETTLQHSKVRTRIRLGEWRSCLTLAPRLDARDGSACYSDEVLADRLCSSTQCWPPAVASTALSRFTVVGLQAAALEPRINPCRHLGPQTDLYSEQRVDFEAAQLPTLFVQLRERSPRRSNELVPQLLIRQEAADDSFNRSL